MFKFSIENKQNKKRYKMEPLIIKGTKDTPDIIFDLNAQNNILCLNGKSIPENAKKFYSPLMASLEKHKKLLNQESIFSINLEYFNSGSRHAIGAILNWFANNYSSIKIKWIYIKEDEGNIRDAEEFKNYFESLKNFELCESE